MAKTRLGWLGPAIVALGAAIAGVAIWYVLHARPKPGGVVDTIDIGGAKLVVRAEQGSDRNFLELRVGDEVKWQALIPHYAGAPGRPGIAWSDRTVTIRVERHGRAEVFAFTMRDAAKLGGLRLAPEHEPIATQTEGPITLSDHVRSYELVGGRDWHQLIAIDLASGGGVWKIDLGKAPIRAGGVESGVVWIEQAGKRRSFDAATGHENPERSAGN